MLVVSHRPLTPEERIHRKASENVRADYVSAVAFHGGFLVAIPMILGGLLGSLLKIAGISGPLAYGIGLNIGFLVGLGVWVHHLVTQRRHTRMARERMEADGSDGRIDILSIDRIERAWDVDALEDFGPGYVLQADAEHYVYVATQEFLDTWKDVEPHCFPGSSIECERWPHSNTLWRLSLSGTPISTEPIAIPFTALAVDLSASCVVLTKAQMGKALSIHA